MDFIATHTATLLQRRLKGLVMLGLSMAIALGTPLARADVFELADGGRVAGQLLNPDESPRTSYVIGLAAGGQITLAADQVKRRVSQSPVELEYERIRPDYPDTVKGQWAMAEWCRERFLASQREVHLRRVIELDPDHRAARAALGYGRLGGQWRTQEELMKSRGYVRYRGTWKSPQEIEAIKRREKQEELQRTWLANVRLYSGWLGGTRTEEARRAIEAIKDPEAVPALGKYLAEDQRRPAQRLYAAALARIGSDEAIEQLAMHAIDNPDEDVRLTCLDHLKGQKRPGVVAYFCRRLGDANNVIVNRAGYALGAMNDPAAIGPLIDALVTTHKFRLPRNQPGQTNATFGNVPGAGGLSVGSGPTTVRQSIRNPGVLDALIALCRDVNFQYDVSQWKAWHAAQAKQAPVDGRRGG